MYHDLKSWPEYYGLLTNGEHEFTIRENDRNFHLDDVIRFHEWKGGMFTGKLSQYYRVRYVLKQGLGLKSGFVLLLLDGPWGNPREGKT